MFNFFKKKERKKSNSRRANAHSASYQHRRGYGISHGMTNQSHKLDRASLCHVMV